MEGAAEIERERGNAHRSSEFTVREPNGPATAEFAKTGDLERPLLQKTWYEGCPGCSLERRKIEAGGAPKKELFLVALIVLGNALPIASIFPFVYFMVRDFHIAKSDQDIGSYAGYIGSALMLGRFLTSTPWGLVADRYGRKPVLICGTASIVVFNTLFGFSTNFWMALVARFLVGVLNGTFGTVRAYASEICSEEHQALGLSLVGTMWGLGLIVGPAVGGYFAQPSTKYPKLFPSGCLFDRFPYALPCLCMSSFALVVLVISFWVPESLHKHPVASENSDKAHEDWEKKENRGQTEISMEDCASEIHKTESVVDKKSLFRNRGMLAAISVYCLWGLHDMAYAEVFSLWSVSPTEYGGLGFTTSDLGDVLSSNGAALLLFQLFLFPRLAKIFGAIHIARIPAVLSLPLVAIYPLIARLNGTTLWAALISASVVKNVFSVCIVTGSFLLINNSVTIDQRGVANGISMTFMSLFKAIGPASAGALFSWSQKRLNAPFLPGMWMIFFLLDIFCLITFIATFEPILPRSLNKPKTDE